ncbi:MAG: glycosyltransferase family 39 protein [Kibdelosporangium sp.]
MSVVESPRQVAPEVGRALAPLAWKPLSLIAAAVAVPLLLLLGRYGYDGDELYFIAAGRHLDWGYADQPPLVPLLAWLMDSLFPGSVYALRLPSLLVIVAGVFLTAQVAREMRGERRAQIIAAAAYAIAFASFGNLLQTDSFNAILWLVIIWQVIRWVRLRQDGVTGRAADMSLLWAGVTTAVALQAKYLVPVLWVAIAIGVLLSGPRDMLRRPLLWAGAGIAVVTALPGLIWQVANDLPQLKHARMVGEQNDQVLGGRVMFLPNTLLMAGIGVGLVLFCYGTWKLLRSPHLRDYRFFGWATLVMIVFFMITNGRFTYMAAIFPVIFAAAAVQMQLGEPAKWWRWTISWPVFALSALLVVPSLALLPRESVERTTAKISAGQQISEDDFEDQLAVGWTDWAQQITWPVLADSVASTYRALPEETRRKTVIVATEYTAAAALEVLGPERGLPEQVYSFSVGYGYLATPPADAGTFLFVGWNDNLAQLFGHVEKVGVVQGNAGELTNQALMLCTGPRESMATLWPKLRYP